MTSRQGRRKQARISSQFQSSLQLDLSQAADGALLLRGIKKMIILLQNATPQEVSSLSDDYSPVIQGILIVGSKTTRMGNKKDLEDELLRLIEVCQERNISVDSPGFSGGILQRPLVLAAYYGLHRSVELLLAAGAMPDLMSGDGMTALHTALQNPKARYKLRDCDRLTAELLLNSSRVTSDLRVWRDSAQGSTIYINGDCSSGSALLSSILNKNLQAATLLRRYGAVLTDRDYLRIRKQGKERHSLVPIVGKVTRSTTVQAGNSHATSSGRYYQTGFDWSFPPTWKVTVALCGSCGLPESIFREHVVTYLPRDWFYTPEQLGGPLPPRLGASLGNLDSTFGGGGWL